LTPGVRIDPLFVDRCSPLAMSGESVAANELLPLFEAVHWAPSSPNAQPWRMLYTLRDGSDWQTFHHPLIALDGLIDSDRHVGQHVP
jgi:hypothetical protein